MQATSQQIEEDRFEESHLSEIAINEPKSSIEPTPQIETEDISGLEADKRALDSIESSEIQTSDGQIVKTLRAIPTEKQSQMPTEEQVEIASQDKLIKEVEQIMSSDLAQIDSKTKQLTGIFTEMPIDKQTLLKQEGERIAREIADMIKSNRLNLKEIHNDIEQWLHIIPAVNKPWLAQQATIITDKIANLHEEYIRDNANLN